MRERIRILLDEILEFDGKNYDPGMNLLGRFDPAFYPPEYLKEHFGELNENSLHPYRESLYYALSLLFDGREVKRADDILKTFLAHAVTPEGDTLWFAEEKHLRDRNGNFFNASALIQMEAHFGAILPQETWKELREVLRKLHPRFVEERAAGSLTYVNPQLGRAAMCCMIAERLNLSAFSGDVKEFVQYAEFLLKNGVNETLTPAYYEVDVWILFGLLSITENQTLIEYSKRLLNELFLKQLRFFGDRFPVPFRRGYNGHYRAKNTHSLLAYILGWTDSLQLDYQHTSPFVCHKALERFPELETDRETVVPRSLKTTIYKNCAAFTFLTESFSLGSFNQYPCESIVWQTVSTGGSGWQDGVVYLTFQNEAESSGILRLEAVDADGNLQTHPFSGDFTLGKAFRLYPFRSFPPEPQVRCRQSDNRLLCLFKTDRIDAVLRRFGFNFHFSRVGKNYRKTAAGALLLKVGNGIVLLQPLKRVNMAGSTLLKGNWTAPGLTVISNGDDLECRMDHYDGPPQSFVQNHVSGGFYLEVLEGKTLEAAEQYAGKIRIKDEFVSDRCNGHIDERDAIRKVAVSLPDSEIRMEWNHYTNECC